MRNLAILLCCILAVTVVYGKKGKSWALLVSSANGWDNYGMQSDAFHAYQVFRQGGIPEDQIVVMAYNDVVNSDINPFKGQMFQSYDLHDVYKGVVVDYTDKTVTKETFQAVLKGDKEAVKSLTGRAGKVIDSGPDDNVFVFISDHGSPGHVCWWDYNDLTAEELNQTTTYLYKNNRYKNLVYYIDTCFAGSMFENILPDNIGVYAATATNATWYAYSTDCDSLAFNDAGAGTCLGGLFSINWAYELQSDESSLATMNMQFQEAKIACSAAATAMQYGDLSIANMKETEFFGDTSQNKKPAQNKRSRRSIENHSVMPKHMQAYYTLKNQLRYLPERSRASQRVAAELLRVEELMGHADQFIKDVSKKVHGRFVSDQHITWAERNFGPINWSCYTPVVKAVKSQCPKMMQTEEVRYYAGAKFGVLINMCNEVHTSTVLAAVNAAAKLNPLCDV